MDRALDIGAVIKWQRQGRRHRLGDQRLSIAVGVSVIAWIASRRERAVMVEPRGAGMVLITLRPADEVRSAEFGELDGEIDADAVAIAATIIKRRAGHFDPAVFCDRYQDVLRE